jgi:hypothetical protein
MSGLAKFRQQYPQYDDMSDAALADALYSKYYSDIPKQQYLRSLGLAPETPGVRETRPITTSGLDIAGATGGALTGAKAGAALGAAGGPFAPVTVPIGALAGGIAGGALGYGMSREAQQLADRAIGAAPAESVGEMAGRVGENLYEGATAEALGRAGGRVLTGALGAGARAAGRVSDIGTSLGGYAGRTATKILREAAGDRLPAIQAALREAPAGATPAQAIAPANAPLLQAILQKGSERAPNVFGNIIAEQKREATRFLAGLAGGQSQTAARQSVISDQGQLRERLIPQLNIEIDAANTAGRLLPRFAGEANLMAGAAAESVQDVRRLTDTAQRATEAAQRVTPVPGMPRAPVRYTYAGELAQNAERVAESAAKGSLLFGEAARFSRAAANSLEAHGLKPLESAPIVSSIQRMLQDPKTMPGNDVLEGAARNVIDDINKWTRNGGVIDGWALDSIRKNSVIAAIARLRPGIDASSQARLSASVMSDIKPLIVKAIEDAGGDGYGRYLRAYADGMQQIDQKKMGAKLLKLYNQQPNQFVRLVEGDMPKEVEKILGPGNFDLAASLPPATMQGLTAIARQITANKDVAEQATAGGIMATEVMRSNISQFRSPNFLNPGIAFFNRASSIIENRLGKGVMERLTNAARSTATLEEALSKLPASERNKVLRVLSEPLPGMRTTVERAAVGGLFSGQQQ